MGWGRPGPGRAGLGSQEQGRPEGDGFQMPGAFLIDNGRMVHAYHHMTAADRPDYVRLASVCSISRIEEAA